jgi:transposase-like protein
VEVDETYVGAPEEDVHGREIKGKAIVVVAAERREGAIGRIRLRQITDCSSESLTPFVCDAVAPGSTVFTDGWLGYSDLKKKGYAHEVLKIKTSGKKAHDLLPRVHMAVSHLHRWLIGTHHGGIQKTHLDYYLDEFTFRFNRRSSRARGLLFYRLLQQAVATDPTPYAVIRGGKACACPNM